MSHLSQVATFRVTASNGESVEVMAESADQAERAVANLAGIEPVEFMFEVAQTSRWFPQQW